MHPFEHKPDTPIIVGDQQAWLKAMHDLYFDIVSDQQVLEIASNNGDIGRQILKHKPKKLTMIDPDPRSQKLDGADFVCDDVFRWLPNSPKFDVIVCFGLFYHLHNGLQLLEMMVNNCCPQYLILDCVIAPHPLAFNKENINEAGSRWIVDDVKVAPFNVNIPFHIFNESLDYMGYQIEKTHILNCNFFPKSNHWVGRWRLV